MLTNGILETFFNGSTDAVCVSDSSRSIIGWNAAAEALTGYSAADVMGADPCDILHHSSRGVSLCATICPSFHAYQHSEESRLEEAAIQGRDGRPVAVSLAALPVLSADGVVDAVVEILRPLTGQAGMERLLSSVTHELRTPLSSITGFVSLLGHTRYGELAPKQREFLDAIRRSGDMMALMVSNVAVGESVSQGIDLDMKPVPIGPLMESVRDMFQALATQKKLVFDLEYVETATVSADGGLLRQVLFNLVNNALHNTPKGNIRLTATVTDSKVRLEVADNGIGIPLAEQADVVRKFSHVTGHKRGLGYGLFVANALVLAHNSVLHLESIPDLGTKVWFKLPAV